MLSSRCAITGIASAILTLSCSGLNASIYFDEVTADSPIYWWRLNNSSGTVLNEGGETGPGTNGNGSVAGTSPTRAVSGLIVADANRAVRFNGVDNSRIDFPSGEIINNTSGNVGFTDRTIEFWFNPNTVSGRQLLFQQGGNTRGINIYLDGSALHMGAWNNSTDGGAQAVWGAGASKFFTTGTGAIEAGEIYHVVMVLEGSNDGTGPPATPNGTMTGYLNGVEFGGDVGSTAAKQGIGRLFNHAGAKIGDSSSGFFYHDGTNQNLDIPFNGTFDELALYDSALSEERVVAHFLAGVPEPSTYAVFGGLALCFGLAGWWRKRKAAA